MKPQEYQNLVKKNLPKTPIWKNVLLAFLIGGIICLIGQGVLNFAITFEETKEEAAAVTLAIMILIGSILTGIGIYDEIAEIGGAGAAIPITGFSNTVTAAAMEFRREGFLLGMGAKMFIIAGPVLVYGILSGFIVALIKSVILGLF
jgi:stage V sporulation protein AC